MHKDIWYMNMAVKQAELAESLGEVPVGAILVSEDDKVLAQAHNSREKKSDPTGHAEINALRLAAYERKNWRLLETTLYISLEPCLMCMSAIYEARVKKIVFGAYDKKGGALSLGAKVFQKEFSWARDPFSKKGGLEIIGGVMHFECSRLLSQFFRHNRHLKKS